MTEFPLAFESIADLAIQIRSRQVSPVALTEAFLERIEGIDGKLHSYLLVTRSRALAEAKAVESALKSGQDLGPLHGIPYAVKDLFDVKGAPTTAGSHLLDGQIAKEDSAAVRKLAGSGMILLGKNHTVQFAFGMVGINNDQGTPHNPWHRTPYAPGGSSSGGAVAVAAGLAPVALGTDTGGSVRAPAALCGIVGLKTTVGRISRGGVYPLSWTLDSVGPLTRSVEDAALVYQALQGVDPEDETTADVEAHDVLCGLKDGVKGLRLAFGETLFFEDVDPQIEKAVRGTGDVFSSLGAPPARMAVPEVSEIWAEKKRSLLIAAEACALNHELLEKHFDELDPVVAKRMVPGRTLSATDYFMLLRRVAALRKRVEVTLREVDALLVPTTMAAAMPLSSIGHSFEAYMEYGLRLNRNTSIGNLLNLCAVSVPCGFTTGGLPIGMMIYAKPFQEDTALRIAYAFEQATQWHTRRPTLDWARAEAEAATGARTQGAKSATGAP